MLMWRHRVQREAPRAGIPGRGLLVLLLCFVALINTASGAPAPAPARDAGRKGGPWWRSELHFQVIMSALTYDKRLAGLKDESLHVGVLFVPSKADSVKQAGQIMTALEKQATHMTFRKHPIVVVGVPLFEGDGFAKRLPDKLHVLYVSQAIPESKLGVVTRATRARKIVTVTNERSYVHKGITLGAVLRKGKPHLLVNYEAACAEGASFSTQLLQLAEVISRPGQSNGNKE